MAAPVDPKEEPVRLSISGDGRYAITAGLYTVRFWDLAEGRCLRVFDGRREGLDRILRWPNSVCLSGDGRVAVAAYHGGVVLVWDFPGGALRLVLDGHDSRAAAIGHDGRLVLGAGRADGTARHECGTWRRAAAACTKQEPRRAGGPIHQPRRPARREDQGIVETAAAAETVTRLCPGRRRPG
ncbi:WD40 repeat domain-containing protein [Streptomyces sp. NPDC001732]